MAISIDLSPTLADQLKNVQDLDGFVETAIHREFNRQRSVQKIRDMAQMISRRPEAQALSEDDLAQLINDL
jgi:Glu-tRNA(Gln) amidotransferase subunit E-like FAD-binding protein